MKNDDSKKTFTQRGVTVSVSAGKTIKPGALTKAVIAFYLLAALMNGEHIHRQARLMRYGPLREVCVAVTRPLDYISRRTMLNRPRRWIEDRLWTQNGY